MSYADARHQAALIERTDRAVTRLHGRDPLRMIQGLVTNDVANAAIDTPVYAAFLTPKGRMVGDARVFRRANNDVWIEADVHALDNIEAHLKKSVPPLFARAERITNARVIGVYGPRSTDVKIASELQMATSYTGNAGVDFIVVGGDAEMPSLPRLSSEDLETLRIEAGTPRWGAELTEDVIPWKQGFANRRSRRTKGAIPGRKSSSGSFIGDMSIGTCAACYWEMGGSRGMGRSRTATGKSWESHEYDSITIATSKHCVGVRQARSSTRRERLH